MIRAKVHELSSLSPLEWSLNDFAIDLQHAWAEHPLHCTRDPQDPFSATFEHIRPDDHRALLRVDAKKLLARLADVADRYPPALVTELNQLLEEAFGLLHQQRPQSTLDAGLLADKLRNAAGRLSLGTDAPTGKRRGRRPGSKSRNSKREKIEEAIKSGGFDENIARTFKVEVETVKKYRREMAQ